ncbi:MAG TPA: hypothetical protein VLT62_21120 [Candidatus Methylomirabilis sp.]|nr:hypothetical protein [Candidatus Methylomirabilis sp.]
MPLAEGKAIVGVCWYRQEQYERFLASADDRNALEDTWADWQVTAERVLRQYRARGLNIRKVEIDLDDLLAYCRAEGRPNDGAARSSYVAHLLERGQDER